MLGAKDPGDEGLKMHSGLEQVLFTLVQRAVLPLVKQLASLEDEFQTLRITIERGTTTSKSARNEKVASPRSVTPPKPQHLGLSTLPPQQEVARSEVDEVFVNKDGSAETLRPQGDSATVKPQEPEWLSQRGWHHDQRLTSQRTEQNEHAPIWSLPQPRFEERGAGPKLSGTPVAVLPPGEGDSVERSRTTPQRGPSRASRGPQQPIEAATHQAHSQAAALAATAAAAAAAASLNQNCQSPTTPVVPARVTVMAGGSSTLPVGTQSFMGSPQQGLLTSPRQWQTVSRAPTVSAYAAPANADLGVYGRLSPRMFMETHRPLSPNRFRVAAAKEPSADTTPQAPHLVWQPLLSDTTPQTSVATPPHPGSVQGQEGQPLLSATLSADISEPEAEAPQTEVQDTYAGIPVMERCNSARRSSSTNRRR